MPYITDYIKWRGDISFDASPLCCVDALILSLISYLDFSSSVKHFPNKSEISLIEASSLYFTDPIASFRRTGLFLRENLNDLLRSCADSKRFSPIKISNFTNVVDKNISTQFSATTFRLPDKTLFVSFRGTDDTLTGWRENFSLSYNFPNAAQQSAASYLNEIGKMFHGRIRVGGHSKGGNLAIYGAAKCKKRISERITDIYNFDGPGFSKEFLSDNEYLKIKDKISTYLPEETVIGILLFNDSRKIVVKSSNKGILQHDAFSWNVVGNNFIILEDISEHSKSTAKVLQDWLSKTTPDQRQIVFDALFDVLSSSGSESVSEIQSSFIKRLPPMLKSFFSSDKSKKDSLISFFRNFIH